MLKFSLKDWETECILIQDLNELPEWFESEYLYLDLETTSGDNKIPSTNPWQNCKLLGISILVDEQPKPIYIPLRHRLKNGGELSLINLPVEPVLEWLKKVMRGSKKWVNHNIKYDAHVLANDAGIDFRDYGLEIVDTLMLCKLAPKEERFTYNLTDIMREWFYTDIFYLEERIKNTLDRGDKDYGLIPMDKMCPYACVDVLCVRELRKQFETMIDAECKPILDVELAVTPILFEIECNGMYLDGQKVALDYSLIPEQLKILQLQIQLLSGISNFRPHTNGDCKELLVNKYNLPVLEFTEKKSPSFSEHALLAYRAMRPDLADILDLMIKFKEQFKLWTSFTKPYVELSIDRRVHPDYNQIVRTGRMSCRTPNMQQLSPEAREYITVEPRWVLVDIDFSQIEFRLIAHFIQAEKIIAEYANNPNADYHQIVADLCGIDRKPAKTMNFMLGYGGGRGKCVETLSAIPEVVGELKDKEAITAKANVIYDKYHSMVPTLKSTTWTASKVMRQRGYVRTLLKRRRYLPRVAHFKAFNTVVQGSAADLFKAALVRVHNYVKGREDIKLIGCVHDSFVLYVREEVVDNEVPKLVSIIEELPEGVTLRVPMKAEAKFSRKNWRECK